MNFVFLLLIAADLSPERQAALDRITASNLRGNLSFLSSDLLEGRDTPSRGLDIAAEFIASQFRKAGLEPVAGQSYFQKALYSQITPVAEGFQLTLHDGAKNLSVSQDYEYQNFAPVDLTDAPVYRVENGVKYPDLTGKAALLEVPDFRAQGGRENFQTYQKNLADVKARNPAVLILLQENGRPSRSSTRLVEESATTQAPSVTLRGPEASAFLKEAKATLTLHIAAPTTKHIELKNVAGVLRGSDPELADTYLLVTAHYDHIGMLAPGEGDRIDNGANDDGSGTVSVIEIAQALSQGRHPRRSILFLTFFGEEKGLYGSRYYAAHPLFPLSSTIAQINLEQIGRTDDPNGPQIAKASITGFTFSDLSTAFAEAGKTTGIDVYDNKFLGDDFFSRSDNQSLADAGIPAHTLAVAGEFPDYHGVGDEWEKIDYDNMVKVDRTVALGLLDLADRTSVPKWNETNPKTEKYVEAWRKLHSR